MIIQFVRLKSNLGSEELERRALDRKPQFEAMPGLLQKYYVKIKEGEYGGIYVWDSMDSLKNFKETELAKTIPQAYEVIEAPGVEIMDVLFKLRD